MSVLKPRTTTVVIYQGDDLEHLAELHRAVVRAEAVAEAAVADAKTAAKSPLRTGDEAPSTQGEAGAVKAAQEAYNAYVDEAAERAIVVRLSTIGRRFRSLLAEHPARTHEVDGKPETVEDDEVYGVNTETFPLALLAFSNNGARTTSLDPAVSDADLAAFLDEVPDGDFETLWQTAYWLNRARGSDPKDSKFSTASLRSGEN
jgi:hypothetical protein